MVVDVNRCVGCQTCTISCKHANDTPPGVQWRRVLDVERGEFPDVERLFLVVGCQHCAEPPCVPVCPTGATRQRADGLVTMDYDTCIGCGYCAVACPYQARTIVHDKEWYYGGAPTTQEGHVHHDERVGVANKCTFCVERIDEAKELGKTPGIDLEYTPACSASCIAQAIHFGDYNDPNSNVSRLVRENAHFQMHAELGTDPQIKYLYEVPNATPGRDTTASETNDEVLSDPANPLVGQHQTFWDERAAMNFTMGGAFSGLAIAAFVAYLAGAAAGDWPFVAMGWSGVVAPYLVAGGGMAVGLFFVFLEIGRRVRFLYVLRRPQSSWMTRETYAVAAFYPALLVDLFWPGPVLHAIVAVGAAAFLYCQGRILHAGKGVPTWRVAAMPRMLVFSGLFEGAGLLFALTAILRPTTVTFAVVAAAVVVLAPINAWHWWSYMASARANGIGPLARRELAAITPWLHGVGHALPSGFAMVALALWPQPVALWFAAIGGVATFAGGALWKFTVITRAGHMQGFAVPKMPQRGSGTLAAPLRLKPI
jgi:phenylacetyl-CoA:acceptor oxidoreductase subunit 1